MNASERINAVIEEVGMSAKAFSEAIGLPHPQTIYDIQKGKTKSITEDMADKIIKTFPLFDKVWLRVGAGTMLKEDPTIGHYLSDEEEYRKAQSLGMQIIPEYSDSFRGGNLGAMISADSVTAYWGFPNLNASLVVEVDGDSMAPRYPSGSKVALREISFDKQFPTSGIPFGEVFGVIVDNGDEQPLNFIKILRRHPDPSYAKKFWLAQSINKEKYDDFDIEINRVLHLFVVVAGVSLNRI